MFAKGRHNGSEGDDGCRRGARVGKRYRSWIGALVASSATFAIIGAANRVVDSGGLFAAGLIVTVGIVALWLLPER